MLLFPHGSRQGTIVMRRNVPITTPRALPQTENGQAQARPFWRHMSRLLGYFAAVGSGAGLSDSELRYAITSARSLSF
jgi:hypothetical protein